MQPSMTVGGRPTLAADGQTFDVTNPATGQVIAQVPRASAEDVDRAVDAAQSAFEGPWSTLPAVERGRALLRLAAVIRDHAEELAQLESRNIGKPISSARWEIGAAAGVFEFYGGAANKLHGETIPVAKPGLDLTLREPIGVVGLIVPWNFPLMMASWKLGPALAAGNTAILKPASWSPLTALRLGELALEAGIPDGVLNVITGPGGVTGAALAAHPGVGKIAFTGETGTGREILRLAAGTIKKVSLELGGKSPNVVFADADIEKFARESPYSVFDNAGQDCCARSRILVQRSVHEQVVELFPQRGAYVAKPTIDQALDIFEARRLIEPALVARLIETLTPERVARLRQHLELEIEARRRNDKRAIVRLSGEFHTLLAEQAGNGALARTMRELATLTCLIIVLYDAPTVDACLADEHTAIVDAIAHRDLPRAEKLMLDHLDHIKRGLRLEPSTEEVDLEAIFN